MAEGKIVDARGQICPKPLILTKKALLQRLEGEALTVIVDNDAARENIERFLGDNKIAFRTSRQPGGTVSEILIDKTAKVALTAGEGAGRPAPDAGASAVPATGSRAGSDSPAAAGHVICLKSNRMGDGPEELGALLIQGFVNTIKEVAPLPAAVVCYNTGIKLACQDSPVVESLRELDRLGVRILVCGTCVNYFGAKEQLGVGTISNMLTIMETLTAAGKVVVP